MKRLRLRFVALLAVLSLVAAAAGASGGDEKSGAPKRPISFLTIDAVNFRGILETFVSEFEKSNPGARIEAEFSGNLGTQVVTLMEAGDQPDIIFMWNSGLLNYLNKDRFAALPDQLAADVKANLFDYALEPATRNGKLYAVPYNYYPSFGTVMYNADIFQKAGITPPTNAPASWDDLMQMAQRLTVRDATGKIVQAGYGARDRADAYWMSWTLQAGGRIFNPDGTAAFDTPVAREAINRYVEIYTKWKVDSPEFGSPLAEFKKGTVAMTLGMPWLASIIRKDAPNIKFGFFPMPTVGREPIWAFYETWMFAISPAAARDNPDAWKFVEYLLQPSQAARFAEFSGEIPSVKAAVADQRVKASDLLAPFLPLMAYGRSDHLHRWRNQDVNRILRSTMPENVIFGKATIDEAVRSAAGEVNRINAGK